MKTVSFINKIKLELLLLCIQMLKPLAKNT